MRANGTSRGREISDVIERTSASEGSFVREGERSFSASVLFLMRVRVNLSASLFPVSAHKAEGPPKKSEMRVRTIRKGEQRKERKRRGEEREFSMQTVPSGI